MSLLLAISFALYAFSIWIFWEGIRFSTKTGFGVPASGAIANQPLSQKRWLVFALLVTVVLTHGLVLREQILTQGQLNLALGNVFSLVCLMTVINFTLSAVQRDILNIGILVMPLGLLGLLTSTFLGGSALIIDDASTALWMHLSVALLTFSILCIAAAQALLLYIQEKQLRNPQPGKLFPALPAIQTMETNLFRLTLVGAIFLTINLLTGMASLWQAEGRTLTFNHHVLLSFFAWIGFIGLLVGRKLYGWRGRVAAKWTMIAFVILVLAFFGSRFVSSIILS